MSGFRLGPYDILPPLGAGGRGEVYRGRGWLAPPGPKDPAYVLLRSTVVPLEVGTLLRSADIRRRYGLLVNDSLVVSAALGAEAGQLTSSVADFGGVKELKLFEPGDLG